MPASESRRLERRRTLTERRVAEELGIDRLQLHLAAAEQRLGCYDCVTHVLYFSDAEVDELAARLGLARGKRKELSGAELARVPEPTGG